METIIKVRVKINKIEKNKINQIKVIFKKQIN